MAEETRVTKFVARRRQGNEAATAQLSPQYAVRLGVQAARPLGQGLRRRVHPADMMQSVFRGGGDQYPVEQSGTLWRLLKKVTENKGRQGERHRADGKDAVKCGSCLR